MAAQGNDEIRDLLGLKGKEEIVTCMVVGYPNVKYVRNCSKKRCKYLLEIGINII